MQAAPETLTHIQTNALAYSYLIASEQLTEFWEWCQADDRREAIKIVRAILNETESQSESAGKVRRIVALLELRTAQVIKLTRLLNKAKAKK